MHRRIKFTLTEDRQLTVLEGDPFKAAVLNPVKKALGYLAGDPRHPSLNAHEFTALVGAQDENILEAYAQNDMPGAPRAFQHYGPDDVSGKKRIVGNTIVAITPHPQ